jgi:dihydroorotate dehydrogenase
MVQQLESVEVVSGIELGLMRGPERESVELVSAATQGELPVLVHLPMDAEDGQILAVVETQPEALTMGPPRGALTGADGELITGRLYGPFLLPLTLQTIRRWNDLTQIPVFGGCGISRAEDVSSIFKAGASAIQLGTVLWTRPEEFIAALG